MQQAAREHGGSGSAALGTPGVAEEAGLALLHEVVDRQGADRSVAYDLLAADALLTEACAEAVRGDDPAAQLERLIARVADP